MGTHSAVRVGTSWSNLNHGDEDFRILRDLGINCEFEVRYPHENEQMICFTLTLKFLSKKLVLLSFCEIMPMDCDLLACTSGVQEG